MSFLRFWFLMFSFLLSCSTAFSAAGDSQSSLFDPYLETKPVRIVSESEVNRISAPSVLVRLANNKLALMMRSQAGVLEPFYVRGIETGFYDTRTSNRTDYDQVFANYRRLANTAMFMIHWNDIEPEDGRFDFTFADMIAAKAAKYGIRIWWVLFMHTQHEQPQDIPNSWIYRIDSRNGVDYGIQWLKDSEGNLHNSVVDLLHLSRPAEIYPAYGNPAVFSRIIQMIHTLARHYSDSRTVVGVQIGNEEGFVYYSAVHQDRPEWESDFNPITKKLYEDWKQKTGKEDWHAFKLAIVKWWWGQFTTAFHDEDPYRVVSFDLAGGRPEGGDQAMIDQEGVDSTIYGEGNIDVIGVMFYGRDAGEKIWPNLDQHYDYVYKLPILVPPEIGAGKPWGTKVHFQEHAIRAIERGAQGYSAYCYGTIVNDDGTLNEYGTAYQKFASMVEANEDVIYGGLPGPGAVSIRTSSAGAQVSQLHRDAGSTLGILHFPQAYLRDNPDDNTAASDVGLELTSETAGRYTLETFRDGKLEAREVVPLEPTRPWAWVIHKVSETEAVFLRVKRL